MGAKQVRKPSASKAKSVAHLAQAKQASLHKQVSRAYCVVNPLSCAVDGEADATSCILRDTWLLIKAVSIWA